RCRKSGLVPVRAVRRSHRPACRHSPPRRRILDGAAPLLPCRMLADGAALPPGAPQRMPFVAVIHAAGAAEFTVAWEGSIHVGGLKDLVAAKSPIRFPDVACFHLCEGKDDKGRLLSAADERVPST